MLLKRLEIHGFKSFAARTVFEFNHGITAIVGPNGSGKSNIADAVRWVLGEQSSRLLRTKKTEDVIFAGSINRQAQGLAEVSLTFENASSQLPLDFNEVTLTRRAYRSGESEYLINRSRVRLRDIVDLLLKANVGQNAYTVIGQGLVDAALSLRPEERRTLFEEAADVKRHQMRMDDARDKLKNTEQNLSRVADILHEIEPRLHYLERQAKNTRIHDTIARELALVLELWYGDQWLRAQSILGRSERALLDCETITAARAADLGQLSRHLANAREERERAIAQAREIEQRCTSLQAQIDEIDHKISIDEQRLAFLQQQLEESTAEVAVLHTNVEAEEKAAHDAKSRVQDLILEASTQASLIQALQQKVAEIEVQLAGARRSLEAAREAAYARATATASRRNQLGQMAERESELRGEGTKQAQEEERLRGRVSELKTAQAALSEQATVLASRQAEVENNRRELDEARQRHEKVIHEITDQLNSLARQKQQLATHLEALNRLQGSFAGLYDGVRAVLQSASPATLAAERAAVTSSARQAGRAEQRPPVPRAQARLEEGMNLPGIIGIVGSLVRVPEKLESAIEVALGSHLQDIVVENWHHAERAIAYLKETRQGRATFLPLDTIRSSPPTVPPTLPGVLGTASNLVDCDHCYQSVVDHLLARTVITEDLETARQLLRCNLSFSQIVTLGGEVVRPGGAVTGGATRGGKDSGMLGRERELRELPGQVTALDGEIALLTERISQARQRVEECRTAEKPLGEAIVELRQQRREVDTEMNKTEQTIQRLRQELGWQSGLASRVAKDLAALAEKRATVADELKELVKKEQADQEKVGDCQTLLQDFERNRSSLGERLSEAKARLGVIDRARHDEANLLRLHEAAQKRLQDQIAQRLGRIERAKDEIDSLASAITVGQEHVRHLGQRLREIRENSALVDQTTARFDLEELELQRRETRLRDDLLTAERQRAHAEVEFQHAKGERQKLAERLEAEGIAAPTIDNGWHKYALTAFRQDLGLTPETVAKEIRRRAMTEPGGETRTATEPDIDEDKSADTNLPGAVFGDHEAEILRRRGDRLRAQLRNLGPVNPDAVREYEEQEKRYQFLTAQVRDLRDAENSLREGIASLETLVSQQFDVTFRAVASEFRKSFAALFGGGSARLVLEDPEGKAAGGIDIVAQPPGKRVQSLSLLSGGERALTAGALILAILRINPVPFCIMDEVDAALDDVNVGRFTAELKDLSQNTQFILITHNKGTIEVADTLYGISLGTDNASKVISLRLG